MSHTIPKQMTAAVLMGHGGVSSAIGPMLSWLP